MVPRTKKQATGLLYNPRHRGPTESQAEDIKDLHALCVSAMDIARRLRLPQAVVVDEINRLQSRGRL